MLNRKTPDTLASTVTFDAFGEKIDVPVVFHNRTIQQIADKTKELTEGQGGLEGMEWVNRELFLYTVKDFNGQCPTHEGIIDLESQWPGAMEGVFYAYHDARKVRVVKN